jgi:alanine racemase
LEGQRGAWATIRLGALRHNFAQARRLAGAREAIAVVKADAYGHGAVPVARALAAEGCRRLAVHSVAEAAALRDAGLALPLLVLAGARDPAEAEATRALALTPVVHHAGQLALLARAASPGAPALPVHVEVDTGMRRMGAPEGEALALLEAVASEPALALEGVFTHLARADEEDAGPSLEQLARFRAVLAGARARGIAPACVHAANSAALLCDALARALPEASAVRPGVLLYGAQPRPASPAPLLPVLTLRARVAQVRRLAAGEAVGYGAEYRARRPTRIATLSIGYADGVPVAASGRGCALVRGQRLPFAGRVSMDYLALDCGELPVEIGDEAILFGEGQGTRLPVEEAAAAAGTIAYELLVRVGARVPRHYLP